MDPFETKLRVAPHLVVKTTREGATFLVETTRAFRVKEPLQAALLTRADGRRTGGELLAELDGQFGGAEVLYALRRLHERGILVTSESAVTASDAAFWAPEGLEQGGLARLQAARVRLDIDAATGAAALRHLLDALGLTGDRGEPKLTLIAADSYLEPAFNGKLRAALERGETALPVRLAGRSAWLGPSFAPGRAGPCPTCLTHCLARNRPIASFLAREGYTDIEPALGHTPASVTAAAAFISQRVTDAVVKGALDVFHEKLFILDLRSFALSEHAVLRRPQCADCGNPRWIEEQLARPVVLTERQHAHDNDGGYRTISPEETCQRYARLISPVTGILTSLGELTERSHPLLPVYAAGYFISPLTAAGDPTETFDRASLGKGRSHAQSRASALCEGLERHAAVWQGDEPCIRKSFRELGSEAIDPRELQNFSELQYQTRSESDDRRRMVPLPFDPDQVIDWSPAWSLTHQARRWLPTNYCFTHAPVPKEERVAHYNPNGHAAGNCLEEAILQGFLELVERDGSALWWYNRVQRPKVDLESFESPWFREVMALDRSRGVEMHVLDLTNDLRIPVMVAVGIEPKTGRYFLGFGCHLDAELAVQRALTELHQVYDPTGKAGCPFTAKDFDDDRFWHPLPGPGTHASAFSRHTEKSLARTVQTCVDRVAAAGMETLVIDYTRPDIGLATAKVVVPGLRHFWPRLGPGRLYDVPVALGWLRRRLAESELNPVPLLM